MLLAATLAWGCAHGPPSAPDTGGLSPYDLVLPTVDGEPFDFARLRGQVAVVTFFATWCFPCMLDVPSLKRLHQEHDARGLRIVAVGMDREGAQVLAPFVRSYEVPYLVLVADERVFEGRTPYGPIKQAPSTFVIDRDGEVRAAYAGPTDLQGMEKLLRQLLER